MSHQSENPVIEAPVIETERLTLRPLAPRDLAPFMVFLTDSRARYIGGPFTPADAWDYCAALIGQWTITGYGAFAICLRGSDRAVGDIGLYRLGGYPEDELGWGMWDTALEGKGLVREAAMALRVYAHDTLGMSTLVSYIDPLNTRSIALAKRLGCTLDPGAQVPARSGWDDILVYRHPATEVV